MNFDIKTSKAVPFALNETQISQNFLDWAIIGENTPIDIACNASINSIKKQFFPIRIVEADYEANWTAKSIWEHNEEYTEYVSRTYSRNKIDGRDVPGRITTNPGQWYFYQKQVPVKKEKTIIDNVELTGGSIDGWYSQKVITHSEGNADFINWLDEITIDNLTDETDLLVKDVEVKALIESDDYAIEQVKSKVYNKALQECKNEIPGNRHEDFKITDIDTNYKITIVLLPVFEVTYEYNGNQYKSWFSGVDAESVFYEEKPEDADLATKNDQLRGELKINKKERLKKGIISFGVIPFAVLFLFGLNLIFGIIALAAAIFLEIKFIKDFKAKHESVKICENNLSVHLSSLDEKRKEIAEIVKNDALTAKEQKEKIKSVLSK